MRYSSRLLAMSFVIMSATGCTPEQPKSAYACPDWSSNPQHNYENADFSNLGCAYNNNLAVQLSNPSDLEKGHGTNVGDGEREAVNIQKYMTATQPTLISPSTTGSSGR